MGEVWRARHATLASPAAIKFLHAASAGSESSRRRFLTEAQVTANLRTKYAVQVFDFGVTDDGLPFLVMDLLEGETLERRIARGGRLSVGETARILQKAARALGRAHQLGIVHRDFKPENVMLVDDEEEGGEAVKVVDFGVAKLIGSLEETLRGALADLARKSGRAASSFSVSSTGLGTPYYMAPEQVQGGVDLGPAADVWAFGVVAYECLTGRRPFSGENVGELLLRILTALPPRPASTFGHVPVAFDAWFAVACAREPARRFPDMPTASAALVDALLPIGEIALDEGDDEEGALANNPRAESLLPLGELDHVTGPALDTLSEPRASASGPLPLGSASGPAARRDPWPRWLARADVVRPRSPAGWRGPLGAGALVALGAILLRDAPPPDLPAPPAPPPVLAASVIAVATPAIEPLATAAPAAPAVPALAPVDPPPAPPPRSPAASPRSRPRRLPKLGL
jgi:serine/threonine-protein kinase